MSRKLFYLLTIVMMLGSLLMVAAVPAPESAAPAKLPPIAIGAMRMNGVHERPPREDLVLNWLKEDGTIPLNATPEQAQAAVNAYYVKFAKQSESWISPEIQQKQLQHEADLAAGKAGVAAVQPVVATYVAMAVQFNVVTETLHLEVDDGAGNCVMQDVVQPGTLQGGIPHPGPRDNNTVWYTAQQTADPKFYENIIEGHEGPGRVRMDLTDPRDGKPGIDLTGYTMQDYYDKVAGVGNVTIKGSVEGWVSVPHSQGYYGADNCQTGGHYGGAGVPPGQLAADAADAFNAAHPTYYTDTGANAFWPKYDANHDGILDTFWLIYAGMGQEAGGGSLGTYALWSHSSDLRYYAKWPDGYKVYEGDPTTTADDIAIGPYTMQPENGDMGVFAEEFGHNFFGLPDLYTNDAQGSIGFWSIMEAGAWGGYLGGSAPVGMPLWFRMVAWCGEGPCNWQEPMTRYAYDAAPTETVIGQLEDTPAGASKGIRIDMPPVTEDIPNLAGTGKAPYSGAGRDELDATLDRVLTIPTGAAGLLTFDSYWEIEEDWDYGYVMVKDGDTWALLGDLDGIFTAANPNGNNLGIGLTGASDGATPLRFDLSAYAGKTITLRLRYKTDAAVTENGWWVDNLKLDGALVDDFEKFPEGWTNSDPGWYESPSTKTYTNYYLVEWRGKTKYDSMTQTAYVTTYSDDDEWRVERVPYNIPGALVYYRNTKYGSTYALRPNHNDPPSYGPKYQLLVVDMNPLQLRIGAAKPYTSVLNNRASSYDAALTLQPSQAFALSEVYSTPSNLIGPFNFPAKPAVTSFHDSMGYYPGFYYGAPCKAGSVCYASRDASAVIPAADNYSIRITDYNGNPIPALYGASVGLVTPLGSGNPGDEGVQYGLHIALTGSTGDTGTIKTWNAEYDLDGGIVQTGMASPVRNGDTVDVHVQAKNIGGMTDAFFFVPINANATYVADSATGGAYAVTAAQAAALAAKHGISLANLPQGGEEQVIGVAYEASEFGVGAVADFGFQVQAAVDEGTISHTAVVSAHGMLIKKLASNPISVVPWTYVTDAFGAARDAYIHSGTPTSAHGVEPFLHVNIHAPGYDGLRSLLGFDVSSIAPDYLVTEATLSLYVRGYSGGAVDGELRAYEVTTPWKEKSVTWQTPWVKPGGDFADTPVGSASLDKSAVGQWISIDVTALVAKWVADPAANNGVMVRLLKASSITGYKFDSRDHWDPTHQPKLEVTYRKP